MNKSLEVAKHLIDAYCIAEFEHEADFSDLTKVGLAYTTTEDDKHEIQVYANLETFAIEFYLDCSKIHERKCSDLDELIEQELRFLSWSDLVDIDIDKYIIKENKTMTYAETKKKLGAIRDKDEVLFRMAISHLMDVGIRNLTEENVIETCKGILSQPDKFSIISNDYMCSIVRTAAELAKFDHIQLLVYIGENVYYDVGQKNERTENIAILQKCLEWIAENEGSDVDVLRDVLIYDCGFDADSLYAFGYGYLNESEGGDREIDSYDDDAIKELLRGCMNWMADQEDDREILRNVFVECGFSDDKLQDFNFGFLLYY